MLKIPLVNKWRDCIESKKKKESMTRTQNNMHMRKHKKEGGVD